VNQRAENVMTSRPTSTNRRRVLAAGAGLAADPKEDHNRKVAAREGRRDGLSKEATLGRRVDPMREVHVAKSLVNGLWLVPRGRY